MDRLKEFIKTTIIGGLGVILPIIILLIVFRTLFNIITNNLRPLTNLLGVGMFGKGIIADIVSIIVVILICFAVGVLARNRTIKFYHEQIEEKLLNRVPGYKAIKGALQYFEGGKEKPFSKFALVRVHGGETLTYGFITESHSDGSYTVVVPQWPVPTQGDIFHVQGKDVFVMDTPVEEAMKFVIGGGAGSKKMIEQYRDKYF